MKAGTNVNAAELLESYNLTTLRKIAETSGISIKESDSSKVLKKEGLVRRTAHDLFTPVAIKSAYLTLDLIAQQVLEEIQRSNGYARTAPLMRRLIRRNVVRMTPKRPYEGNPKNRGSIFEDVVSRLTVKGLVFSQKSPEMLAETGLLGKHKFVPGDYLIIPDFVAMYLPPPPTIDKTIAEIVPPEIRPGNSQAMLRNLYLYWSYIRENRVQLLKTGYVGKRDLKLINATLLLPDPKLADAKNEAQAHNLFFLRRQLTIIGAIKTEGNQIVISAADFWTRPTATMISQMVKQWVNDPSALDLPLEANSYLPMYPRARQILMKQINAFLQPDRWEPIKELLYELSDCNNDFLFPRTKIEKGQHQYVSIYDYQARQYLRGEKAHILEEITRYEADWMMAAVRLFNTLGLFDIGIRDGLMESVRLTPLGATVFHGGKQASEPQAAEADSGNIIVQPSFQILAMGGVSVQALARLDAMAERIKVDINAFEYRLTRESVYKAQQAGIEAEDVKTQLTAFHGQSLPQNIIRSLDEWGARQERIVFRPHVTLLQAAEPALLAQLQADKKVSALLGRSVLADVAFVKSGKRDAVITTLIKQATLPVVADASPTADDSSVTIADDGRITPIHAVLSLTLRGRLAQVAEGRPDGSWWVTEKTVQQAGIGKEAVRATLQRLTQLQAGELPTALIAKIKRWGAYYGPVSAASLTLLQCQDDDILQELCQHPELGKFITPFVGSRYPLAIVAKGDLKQVRTLLAQLGIKLGKEISFQ